MTQWFRYFVQLIYKEKIMTDEEIVKEIRQLVAEKKEKIPAAIQNSQRSLGATERLTSLIESYKGDCLRAIERLLDNNPPKSEQAPKPAPEQAQPKEFNWRCAAH
jgi:hypothetical protein